MNKYQKDKCPDIYGYSSSNLIAGNENCGYQIINGEKEYINFKVPFASFIDSDGDRRFVACSEEYYKWLRNEERNNKRKIDEESRCKIPAFLIEKDGKYVKDEGSRANRNFYKTCRHKDCLTCPFINDNNYVRKGNALSLDSIIEDGLYNDFIDEETETPLEYVDRKEKDESLIKAVNLLKDEEKYIFNLLKEGYSYSQIGKMLNYSKSKIQFKVKKIITFLQNQLKE